MTADALLQRFREGDVHGALAAYVMRQRWFAAAGSEIVRLDVADAVSLAEGDGRRDVVLLLTVHRRDGASDEYCVPLTIAPADGAPVSEGGDPRLVLVTEEDGRAVVIYDLLADERGVDRLWSLLRGGATATGTSGEIRFHDRGLPPDGEDTAVRPLGREQSNSSVVRGERDLLKVLRRLARGINPELEMTAALAGVGFTHVAAPLADAVHRPAGGGEPALVAVVQPFLHNGTDGWALALTSLRAHYADVEEADADTSSERAVGGATFVPEAARIGDLIGAMHLALLDPSLDGEMAAQPAGPEVLQEWSDRMLEELDRVLAEGADGAEPLRRRRSAVERVFAAVRTLADGGSALRIHGDLHLGQMLRTDDGWTVVDFEGEPDLPSAERRRRSSALADVAGLLRSFDYAAAVALTERVDPADPEWERLMPHGHDWARATRDAFWAAYTVRVAGSALLPTRSEDVTALRRAFELRKAVYELAYELGHRPTWARIPLRFITEAVS